jgi:hypothetical protein
MLRIAEYVRAARRLASALVPLRFTGSVPGGACELKRAYARGAPQLPGKPRAATLSATLSHESNEADWNVGEPSTCLMS